MKMRIPVAWSLVAGVALLFTLAVAAQPPQTPDPGRFGPQAIDRQGAWLDSVVMTKEHTSVYAAVTRLQANELDVYAATLTDPVLFQTVLEDPDLTLTQSYGTYNELTFNPHGPTFSDGRLNPFGNAAIREAMNWLVDRNYVAQSIFDGSATPRWVPITHGFADYVRYESTIQGLEAEYSYDLSQAQTAITAEMLGMGAYLQGGVWHYDGQPVIVIFLIRIEDERKLVGDYVADQLEQIGFSVDRQYKTLSEASPIWNRSAPADGLWHIYTGGWITTSVSRDNATNFGYFYTPRGSTSPLWQAYTPSPAFDEVCGRLWNRDFSSMEERGQLFEQALDLALEDSVRVWLVDETGFAPRRAATAVASDLAGSIVGAAMWPYVARFHGVEGGTMRIAQPDLLLGAWNPIAGSNWIYDHMSIRATRDYDFLSDPTTGLYWSQRAVGAQVVVKAGLPVTKTLDWVDLSFVPEIVVPDGAWVDWDATGQRFITAAEQYTETATANTKCTVTYPSDLFTTVTWHDGSPLSLADFVMRMIMAFDQGKPDSPIYDETQVSALESFLSHFKGVQIESTDPLVITTYDDALYLDAEWAAARSGSGWWPNYTSGPGAWHTVGLGVRAEAAGELAFSTTKAGDLGVAWMNLIGGSSLGTLETHMNAAAVEGYIPYEPTLGLYVTPVEAAARWASLQTWYAARGHFWLGTGPFYLAALDWGAPSLTLEHFAAFPDAAGRWDAFAAPQPQVQINYPGGAAGSYFNVTGTGFPPDSTASIVANDHILGQQPVDGSGAVAFTLTTGQADPGVYHLRVQANPVAGLRFTVDPAAPERPREGEAPLVVVPEGLIPYYIYLPVVVHNP
jgi:peptide/nickel transport system substrate-binding protein